MADSPNEPPRQRRLGENSLPIEVANRLDASAQCSSASMMADSNLATSQNSPAPHGLLYRRRVEELFKYPNCIALENSYVEAQIDALINSYTPLKVINYDESKAKHQWKDSFGDYFPLPIKRSFKRGNVGPFQPPIPSSQKATLQEAKDALRDELTNAFVTIMRFAVDPRQSYQTKLRIARKKLIEFFISYNNHQLTYEREIPPRMAYLMHIGEPMYHIKMDLFSTHTKVEFGLEQFSKMYPRELPFKPPANGESRMRRTLSPPPADHVYEVNDDTDLPYMFTPANLCELREILLKEKGEHYPQRIYYSQTGRRIKGGLRKKLINATRNEIVGIWDKRYDHNVLYLSQDEVDHYTLLYEASKDEVNKYDEMKAKARPGEESKIETGSCPMCKQDYKPGEWIRRLTCMHSAHRDCFDFQMKNPINCEPEYLWITEFMEHNPYQCPRCENVFIFIDYQQLWVALRQGCNMQRIKDLIVTSNSYTGQNAVKQTLFALSKEIGALVVDDILAENRDDGSPNPGGVSEELQRGVFKLIRDAYAKRKFYSPVIPLDEDYF